MRSRALKGRRGGEVVFHLHWEDAVLRSIEDRDEAADAAPGFVSALAGLVEAGARLIWTKHNLRPHDFMHADLAEAISTAVAARAKAIIVHSPAALHAVSGHGPIARS